MTTLMRLTSLASQSCSHVGARRWIRKQRQASIWYESHFVQFGTGAIILASYVMSMITRQVFHACLCTHSTSPSCMALLKFTGAQIQPDPGGDASKILNGFEILFTVLFTLELMLNMFGHWLRPVGATSLGVRPHHHFEMMMLFIAILASGESTCGPDPYFSRAVLPIGLEYFRLFRRDCLLDRSQLSPPRPLPLLQTDVHFCPVIHACFLSGMPTYDHSPSNKTQAWELTVCRRSLCCAWCACSKWCDCSPRLARSAC